MQDQSLLILLDSLSRAVRQVTVQLDSVFVTPHPIASHASASVIRAMIESVMLELATKDRYWVPSVVLGS